MAPYFNPLFSSGCSHAPRTYRLHFCGGHRKKNINKEKWRKAPTRAYHCITGECGAIIAHKLLSENKIKLEPPRHVRQLLLRTGARRGAWNCAFDESQAALRPRIEAPWHETREGGAAADKRNSSAAGAHNSEWRVARCSGASKSVRCASCCCELSFRADVLATSGGRPRWFAHFGTATHGGCGPALCAGATTVARLRFVSLTRACLCSCRSGWTHARATYRNRWAL